MVYIRCRCQAA